LREALSGAKAGVSRCIEGNNGISTRHLSALFQPLGVNVPTDPVWTASLDELIKLRHQWAHRNRFSTKIVKSAGDIEKAVRDCMKFAAKLAVEARTARP
jgi:hypothetical protein